MSQTTFEIFLGAPPGLETTLCEEAIDCGFRDATAVAGGVTITGGWPEIWRANLILRGATRVLVRIGTIRAVHLAQLDKRARDLPWTDYLASNEPIRVEATAKRSKLYHTGAIAQRIATAASAATGAQLSQTDGLRIMARMDHNLCTVSLDTSGDLLHKRGYRHATGKAPLRETLAALILRACDYRGGEPVLDPMCGSGTLIIEAAQMALGLAPGRNRSFAFEHLAGFDTAAWADMKSHPKSAQTALRFYGSDRDRGAVENSIANAARAGVSSITAFHQHAVGDVQRPDGPPGLIIVNPPYGDRLGDAQALKALYAGFGRVMQERFRGWRIGLVTRDEALARATGLPFTPPGPPFPNGDLRVRLYRTDVLT